MTGALSFNGGEGEIRTLGGSFPPQPLSRRSISATHALLRCRVAEEVGFEPTKLLHLTVFKTAAFNRSATPPKQPGLYITSPSPGQYQKWSFKKHLPVDRIRS